MYLRACAVGASATTVPEWREVQLNREETHPRARWASFLSRGYFSSGISVPGKLFRVFPRRLRFDELYELLPHDAVDVMQFKGGIGVFVDPWVEVRTGCVPTMYIAAGRTSITSIETPGQVLVLL